MHTLSDALVALDWLVAWLLEKTYQYSAELQRNGMSAFNVRNNIQIFHAQTLSIVYAQVSFPIIQELHDRVDPRHHNNY